MSSLINELRQAAAKGLAFAPQYIKDHLCYIAADRIEELERQNAGLLQQLAASSQQVEVAPAVSLSDERIAELEAKLDSALAQFRQRIEWAEAEAKLAGFNECKEAAEKIAGAYVGCEGIAKKIRDICPQGDR